MQAFRGMFAALRTRVHPGEQSLQRGQIRYTKSF